MGYHPRMAVLVSKPRAAMRLLPAALQQVELASCRSKHLFPACLHVQLHAPQQCPRQGARPHYCINSAVLRSGKVDAGCDELMKEGQGCRFAKKAASLTHADVRVRSIARSCCCREHHSLPQGMYSSLLALL